MNDLENNYFIVIIFCIVLVILLISLRPYWSIASDYQWSHFKNYDQPIFFQIWLYFSMYYHIIVFILNGNILIVLYLTVSLIYQRLILAWIRCNYRGTPKNCWTSTWNMRCIVCWKWDVWNKNFFERKSSFDLLFVWKLSTNQRTDPVSFYCLSLSFNHFNFPWKNDKLGLQKPALYSFFTVIHCEAISCTAVMQHAYTV